ncbi:hypothetical protein LEN26_000317 [Aphanomyces euteiches]|nr:hypothetical protein AeMF1_019130 [Aphanomyces euteiches]KAH9163815.1 hypothetical protein LEN26_000317 [Aphanomyces euteiches]KAH9195916.1 hypothetical protein AeNC1_002105 [Aphanomyces euteiches]
MELVDSALSCDRLLQVQDDTGKDTKVDMTYRESHIGYVLPFLTIPELFRVTLVNKEIEAFCEQEWKVRVKERFGALRFAPSSYRRVFAMRRHFERQVASSNVSARVYLMNTNGDTTFFRIDSGKPIMCSRERAVVYNRCERMFDLSLRINRSIQEISALIGMVSLDEARDLLNEHINLMASVAALRGSLLFESELFQVFPAPVLLDSNVLLRGTHSLEPPFRGVPLMMQTWVSLNGVIFRPLSIPQLLHTHGAPNPDQTSRAYSTLRFHELSGMTIDVDDNSVRYNLTPDSICLNTLASNAYLLYLFNPTAFRPLEWTYEATLSIESRLHLLPVQREGVFLNQPSCALRVFFSYGKIVQDDGEDERQPLGIACSSGDASFAFSLVATNRVSNAKKVIVSKTMNIRLPAMSDDSTSRPEKLERHVQLGRDAVICYNFDATNHLQYVELAIGYEPLLDVLGIAPFLMP